MYLYHVLFTLINIYGIDCQKKMLDFYFSSIVGEDSDDKLIKDCFEQIKILCSLRPTTKVLPLMVFRVNYNIFSLNTNE
jgi:hypothetical protein